MAITPSLLHELQWRGLLYQTTDGLAQHLSAAPRAVYAGFDPTASSLHVGNLVPVMGLVHAQRAGHRPIALVGGGTGLIGDPSGKGAERQLSTLEIVEANARAIHAQLERFLDISGPAAARMENNAQWLRPLHAIDFMRDVGKHFTVNYMIAKESVKARLDGGISYTEFSYMLLQAYDYLELHRRSGATVQLGGSDQWGNIVAGVELIRRTVGAEAHALTLPLLTAVTGTKFGKTEAGSVWLDASRTTPYQFYQFWVQTDDRDVGRYLRFFTLLSREEVETLERAVAERPDRREGQHALAREVTTRVHGEDAARAAAEMSALLFSGADPRALSLAALEALRDEVPSVDLPMPNDDGTHFSTDVLDLLVASKLSASKGAARRLLEQGGIYVNGRRRSADDRQVTDDDLLGGRFVLLRKGARDHALVRMMVAPSR